MKRAATFMTQKVAVHGGYVWSYAADLSRRWGEMEARPQMIWVQSPGTIQVGHVWLDAYHATGDEFYYRAAQQVAGALMEGQLACGGWHYLIDFAGEKDMREWYDTVGKNGWRLEEFQHYYGNATFDDSSTSDATQFMLRFYLEKKDPRAKASLDRAIQFILDSQYKDNGGWPQRYPKTDEFHHSGLPDYTGYITFNDEVTGGNVELLVQCYQALGDKRLLEPIRRGMDVFLLTQGAQPQPGWSLQHSLDLKPVGARTYEPPSLATHTTAANIRFLIKFYRMTGDPRYLTRIPEAIAWLESVKNPPGVEAPPGRTHPTFIEIGTNKPLYIHRAGSNVVNGHYYADYDWHNTIGHYSSFRAVDTKALREEYEAAKATPPAEATKDSDLLHPDPATTFPKYFTSVEGPGGGGGGRGGRGRGGESRDERVHQVITALDAEGRWIAPLRSTSHPYTHDGSKTVTPGDFVRTQVGDETDTSPYNDPNPVPGISTAMFNRNMSLLIGYVAKQ